MSSAGDPELLPQDARDRTATREEVVN